MKIQSAITEVLVNTFKPNHLQILNESHMHSVPPNSETHFKVIVVSDDFNGLRSVQRHQKIYGALAEWMNNGIHALALHTYTPDEWDANQAVPDSPDCKGGSKRG